MTNEEAIKILKNYHNGYFGYKIDDVHEAHNLAIKALKERPQGKWIIVKDEKWGDNVKCPFCGKELAGTDLNFCCKCGAKLTESEKMNGGCGMTNIVREWSCQDCRWCYCNCKDHSIACEQEDGICDDFEIWEGEEE